MGGTRSYSANAADYKLLEEVGHGSSATVYRAIYLPLNEIVAVKCLDLDRCNSNLDDIRREAQTMSLIDHPNVIRAYCSFVVDRNLWVAMPFMDEGSCLHLMKIAYPDGFEEAAIGSILKETLKALVYLHHQGHIHRDVKAGNILLDRTGFVKLADFGVSACMFDSGDRQRSRNTFVGTPCWMAPEVLQPGSGYNAKADIWSFGITALELAHGHAPFSKYPPMKVLLMTIQNAPPGLDYDRDKKFSKSFKEMVAMCLVKDQSKRPTAEKLLKHAFFKNAKPPELSVKKLFADLPPLWTRVKALQLKDAAQLALKKMPSAEQEALSQSEYRRGVSAWNFDVEDLKAQASLVRDDDKPETRDADEIWKSIVVDKVAYEGQKVSNESAMDGSLSGRVKQQECSVEGPSEDEFSLKKNGSTTEVKTSALDKDGKQGKPIMAKSCQTQSGPLVPGQSSSERGRTSESNYLFENELQPVAEKAKCEVRKAPSFSGPLMLPNRASANSLSAPIKSSGGTETFTMLYVCIFFVSFLASTSVHLIGFRDSLDEKSKANLVQIKGRFSVTSENLDLVKDLPLGTVPRRSSQTSSLRKSASIGEWLFDSKRPVSQTAKEVSGTVSASVIVPHIQNLFQQTSLQQDLILSLLSSLQPADVAEGDQNGKLPPLAHSSDSNGYVEPAPSERERLLMTKIYELQSKTSSLTDELNAERQKYAQLLQQLNLVEGEDVNGNDREVDSDS